MTCTIHLVFKTHLDIGFTDHAEKVRALYHRQFIPQALTTAEHFHAENPSDPQFVWTTGAWLILDHLERGSPAEVARLERAIGNGLIRWHALPFTTHTELMSPDLFRAGLSMSEELDRHFGLTTRAAKMTDVPGHTLGMVPLLAEAGVRFLHLGVNTASPVPDLPDIFRWRAPSGDEILVMYQKSYGETDFPEGCDFGLSFAHTADNIGPQSVPQVVEARRELAHAHPGAVIRAGTLEDFTEALWPLRDRFPVVDCEIGDSWIHGAGSDPVKLARFRALQRLHDGMDPSATRTSFGRRLAMVAEHTWGVDIKSYLRDETAWDRPDFEAARASDYRFAYSEASWAEQRAYLDQAVAALEVKDRAEAEAVLAETIPPAPASPSGRAEVLETEGWRVTLDRDTGNLTTITAPGGQELSGAPLIAFRHESYDSAELQRHLDSYLQHRAFWAIYDHDKPGLQNSRTARTESFPTRLAGAGGQSALLTLPDDANRALGAPERVEVHIEALGPDRLRLSFVLREKPANRMPEAGFLSFAPTGAADWHFLKMGLWLPSHDIARRGGGQLQAIMAARGETSAGRVTITPLDTALVGPMGRDFIPFQPEPPDFAQGLRFNLYNNKWGTNFPMWWEGDLLTRFEIALG